MELSNERINELLEEGAESTKDPDPISEETKRTIFGKKLLQVVKQVGPVYKDKRNSQQDYKYVSAEMISQKVQEAMNEVGLVSTQDCDLLDTKTVKIRDREYVYVVVKVTLTIADTETRFSATTSGIGSGMDSGDKAAMKAMTAAHKYALIQWLNIPIGDDPEADENLDRATEAMGFGGASVEAPAASQAAPEPSNTPSNPMGTTGQTEKPRPRCFCDLEARLYVDKKNSDPSKWWAKYYCPKPKDHPTKCDFKLNTTDGLWKK